MPAIVPFPLVRGKSPCPTVPRHVPGLHGEASTVKLGEPGRVAKEAGDPQVLAEIEICSLDTGIS